ncbi:MAG: ABC transporter permease [Thermonemataceae bacterium]
MKVIGVLEEKLINAKLAKEIGVASTDWAVCVPMKSFILRFNQTPQTKKAQINHELDRIIIKVAHSEQLVATAQVVNQMLARRHPQQNYYKVIVPEELIKRQRKTRRLFNIVLGAIAGISLLVGGIGIMNIMYASASERTRELGVRIVAGATRQDIITQFLAEAILICFLGGLIGILLGIGMGITINKVADIPVVISLVGVFWAFVIATFTGIFFGIQPARKAARNNPIESLRYE